MERELQHFSHEHPLILKAEEFNTDDGTHHDSDKKIKVATCYGCLSPISGPFYSCSRRECAKFFLHKVCAELPSEINHPEHQKHPLTLSFIKIMTCDICSTPVISGPLIVCKECDYACHQACAEKFSLYMHNGHNGFATYKGAASGIVVPDHCHMCGSARMQFVYSCSICSFSVDIGCATASHTIEDKCHMHPLTPIQIPTSFPCYICGTERIGVSYKCKFCAFWVHQNCTLIPDKLKHSDHNHFLSLLSSASSIIFNLNCDICCTKFFLSGCLYHCEQCSFFAHVRCATKQLLAPSPRDQCIEEFKVEPALLPMQQKSSDLVSWFTENYTDRDVITNLILGFTETYIDQDSKREKEIKSLGHSHSLFLMDDDKELLVEIICDACAMPISSAPCYGCIGCGFFLHKCCTELPKHILHPADPEHQISLYPDSKEIFRCLLCFQISNGYSYRCFKCEFCIDTKCASLVRPVKHEGHRHPLIGIIKPLSICTACGIYSYTDWILKCDTCSFILCYRCAMASAKKKHRYDEHPFVLTYSPPVKDRSRDEDYICDLCENNIFPKHWFYSCHLCDQSAHIHCIVVRVEDSQINYRKKYKKLSIHRHSLSLVLTTHTNSTCNKCRRFMKTGFSIGLQCMPCNFWIHLLCYAKISNPSIPN